MLNWNKDGLEIFDNFHIDFNLPKWQKRRNEPTTPDDVAQSGIGVPSFNRFNRTRTGGVNNGIFLVPTADSSFDGSLTVNGVPVALQGKNPVDEPKKLSFFTKLFGGEKKRRKEILKQIEEDAKKPNFEIADKTSEVVEPEMTVEEFFVSVKNSAEEIALVKERLENYEKAIAHLKRSGQIAMLEVMNQEVEIHRAETQLYAIGFRKVITEASVVEFSKKACRELRLDWIKNFGRVIPEAVIEAKEKCDENLIFDNYVILHYDPYSNGSMKTQSEIEAERKKDPILFGVLAGSNKLYYIADWVDEYCDLTFDKIVDKLGEEAIRVNDLTADVKISKI